MKLLLLITPEAIWWIGPGTTNAVMFRSLGARPGQRHTSCTSGVMLALQVSRNHLKVNITSWQNYSKQQFICNMRLHKVWNMLPSIPQISSNTSKYNFQHLFVLRNVFLPPQPHIKTLGMTEGKHSFFLCLLVPRLLWAVSGKHHTLLLLSKSGHYIVLKVT